jgi:hypothetical protein
VIASVLFAVGVVALVTPAASGRFRADRLAMLAGAFGLLLVLFRMVDLPLPDIQLQGSDQADSSRGIGIFLALLATAGIGVASRFASRGRARPTAGTPGAPPEAERRPAGGRTRARPR